MTEGVAVVMEITINVTALYPVIWAKAAYFATSETTLVLGGQSDNGLVPSNEWLEFSQVLPSPLRTQFQ